MVDEPIHAMGQRLPWVLVGLAILTVAVLGTSHRRSERQAEAGEVISSILPEDASWMRFEPEAELKWTGDPTTADDGNSRDVAIEPDPEEGSTQPVGQAEGLIAEDDLAGKGLLHNLGLGGNGIGGDGDGGRHRLGSPSEVVESGSPSETPEQAIAKGLRWLADHQSAGGSWDTDGFKRECARAAGQRDGGHAACGGAGEHEWADPGLTGLSLLAFLGTGNTHRSGQYRDCVEKAVRHLHRIQTAEGCFGPKDGHYMYNHAIAALAMADAYAMSGRSPLIRAAAQKGIDFLARAQNPGLAWRYSARSGDNDTSVTGWAIMALRSAELAGLTVPPECFTGARAWIDQVTDRTYYQVGYRARPDPGARGCRISYSKFDTTEAMTAIAMISRIALGAKATDPAVNGGADLLVDQLPEWSDPKGTIDMYYWYLGTLAMFQVGGARWDEWNGAMKTALLGSQRCGGGALGSWDSIGAWGAPGGRVYATAIGVLTLEIDHGVQR